MSQSTESHIRDSQISQVNAILQTYQIQPFQIKPKSLTHAQIDEMVNHWDSFAKIQEKFSIWSLNFTFDKVLKIAPEKFYSTAIHYVFLKKMTILIKNFDENEVINKSRELKEIYKVQSLKGKLKGKRFDYLLIIAVKLIGFFLGSHTRDVIINEEFESQIYTMLVYVLLGTEVGQKTYHVMLQKYKKKASIRYNRSSIMQKCLNLPILESKKQSQNQHKTTKTTAYSKKRIGRTECRTGTQLFKEPSKVIEDRGFREMKQTLKFNLQVKQFIPKPKEKQSLNTILSKSVDVDKRLDELKNVATMEKNEMKHKKIFYTQMSSSLDLLRNNHSLSVLQNHYLKIKPEKQAKFFQLIKKSDILKQSKSEQNLSQKLPKIEKSVLQQVYSYHTSVLKKKQPSYWKKVIYEMKENHYENIEQFPPISAKMYFLPGQLDDEVKRQSFSSNSQVKNYQNSSQQDNYHGEYITQRVVQMPKTIKEINMNQTQNKIQKNPFSQNTDKKTPINTRAVIEEPKNQVSIVQYSKLANDSEIYKDTKSFLNVYSNKPIDDMSSKLKKKSFQQLKDMQKKFYQDCKIRQQKIQESYFS